MYPEHPQPLPPPTPPPVDYLNQIAPQQQSPVRQLLRPGPKLFIFVGLVLVVIVIILVVVVNVITGAQRHPLEQLAARLSATEKVVDESQSKLKSSKLRSANSNLKIYLTNTNRDIAAPLKSSGVDVAKLPASVVQEESGDDLSARLEDARLNAVFDRTYAREMSYRLATLLTLMQQIYSSTGNQELKEFLESAYDNLEPTQAAFEDFSVAEN